MLAVLTVNSEIDEIVPGDGNVTLREAIIAANEDSTTDLGDSAHEADKIVFDPSLDGKPIVIRIGGPAENDGRTGDLDITEELTITGNGPAQTIIDGNSIDRVFDIHARWVRLENVGITGGEADGSGGAIRSHRELQLSNSAIYGNSANERGGGIFTLSGASIESSTITENTAGGTAGGIYATGNIHLKDSTLSRNTGITGGAHSNRELTILNSSVWGNTSTGGDLNAGGVSAGLNVTVTDSTISQNFGGGSAGTGAIFSRGNTAISRSTIVQNIGHHHGAGGIKTLGRLDLSNSILADNVVVIFRQDQPREYRASSATFRHSLIGSNFETGLRVSRTADANGNLIGSRGLPMEPRLGPIQDNGGPTWTHALLPGSPAIDAGAPSPVAPERDFPSYDQRGQGFDRIDGLAIDIGAVEFSQPLPGDANFDGVFDSTDLIRVFQANQYEDEIANNSTWRDGDWNGDGEFDTSDLILAFQSGNYQAFASPTAESRHMVVDSLIPNDVATRDENVKAALRIHPRQKANGSLLAITGVLAARLPIETTEIPTGF
ncbi:choice-of-anchor Q domain-containing protein [Planctomycetota bacterium]